MASLPPPLNKALWTACVLATPHLAGSRIRRMAVRTQPEVLLCAFSSHLGGRRVVRVPLPEQLGVCSHRPALAEVAGVALAEWADCGACVSGQLGWGSLPLMLFPAPMPAALAQEPDLLVAGVREVYRALVGVEGGVPHAFDLCIVWVCQTLLAARATCAFRPFSGGQAQWNRQIQVDGTEDGHLLVRNDMKVLLAIWDQLRLDLGLFLQSKYLLFHRLGGFGVTCNPPLPSPHRLVNWVRKSSFRNLSWSSASSRYRRHSGVDTQPGISPLRLLLADAAAQHRTLPRQAAAYMVEIALLCSAVATASLADSGHQGRC